QVALVKIMNDQLAEFSSPAGAISVGTGPRKGIRTAADLRSAPGFKEGFDNLAIRDYLRAQGAKVTELAASQNAKLKLRHIWSALEQGYGVKVIVDFGRRAGTQAKGAMHQLHAIAIEGMVIGAKNGKPAVNAVRVYDSNVGRLIEVPAKIFESILARDYDEGI